MSKQRSLILINKILKFQLRQLKQHGFRLVWINENLSTQPRYKEHTDLLDEVITVASLEDSELSKLGGEYSFPADSLILANEGDLLVAAKLAQIWNLDQSKTLTPSTADLASNKYMQRERLIKLSPEYVSKFKLIKNASDLISFSRELGSEFILKPLNLDSSRGVKLVTASANIEEVYSNTIAELQGESSETILLLAEEFIRGGQYSVDSYHTAGKIILTPICKQIIGYDRGFSDFRTLYSTYPSYLEPDIEQSVKLQLNRILSYMDLPSAVIHTEFKIDPTGKVKIIEFNPRIGGFRNALLSIAYGFKHYENFIRAFTGDHNINVNYQLQNYAAVFQIWADSPGIYSGIGNLDELEADPRLVSLHQKCQLGDKVGPPSMGFGKIAYAIIKSEQDLVPYLETLAKTIEVEVS